MKGLKKIVAAVAATMLVLTAFAFIGCTDKDKPRVLTDAEKSIVGTWVDADYPERFKYIFNDDGTYDFIEYYEDGTERRHEYNAGTFKQTGEDYEAERGHYYIIYYSGVDHFIFDSDPNNIYKMSVGSDKVNEYPSDIRVTE